MGQWSLLEYTTISTETSKTNGTLYLSSLPPTLLGNLPQVLQTYTASGQLIATSAEVSQLPGIEGRRVCLLDPSAKVELTPEDGEKFDWYIFGGILGSYPQLVERWSIRNALLTHLIGDDPPRGIPKFQ